MLLVSRNISILAAALLVFSSAMASGPPARKADRLVCDVAADIALEIRDYPTAIDLHRKLLRSGKNNALAHYHLGFAYGMRGNVSEEISEYHTAIGLGLKVWDLFLNLGLAYYDQHDLNGATGVLMKSLRTLKFDIYGVSTENTSANTGRSNHDWAKDTSNCRARSHRTGTE